VSRGPWTMATRARRAAVAEAVTRGGSIHTPGERLKCRADGQPWPCMPWRVARARTDAAGRSRQSVIFPENPGEPWRKPEVTA
jgi:hypothetical protein